MQSINRTAVVIKPKQPFVDWINSIPGDSSNYTLEQLSEENTTFLVPESNNIENSKNYIRNNYRVIFEFELWGWMKKEGVWPKNRNWEMFNKWFDIEINSEVFDLVDEEIEKDDV